METWYFVRQCRLELVEELVAHQAHQPDQAREPEDFDQHQRGPGHSASQCVTISGWNDTNEFNWAGDRFSDRRNVNSLGQWGYVVVYLDYKWNVGRRC